MFRKCWAFKKKIGPHALRSILVCGLISGLVFGWVTAMAQSVTQPKAAPKAVHNKSTYQPYWTLGKIARGTLILKDGNLSCSPYNCSIPIKNGESFQPYKNSKKIFELVKTENGQKKVLLYYYYSNDVVNIPAYSGDPIGILIAFDPKKIIRFTRLIEMNEPILIEGIPIEDLIKAVDDYQGKNILDTIVVGKTSSKDQVSVDMITGATVTSLVLNRTMLASSRLVAVEVGVIKSAGVSEYILGKKYKPKTWDQLVKMGAIGHLLITPQEMDLPASKQPWLDLYYADLTQPTIGRSILGDSTYKIVMKYLKPKQHIIMMAARGTWSFKGSAFVRGGIYARFHLTQGMHSFTFRDVDYQPLYTIQARGVPILPQRGLFTITSAAYNPTIPWKMIIVGNRFTGKTAVSKLYKSFVGNYKMPKSFLLKNPAYKPLPGLSSGSFLKQIWERHIIETALYILLWLAVVCIFIWRKWIAHHPTFLETCRISVFLAAIILVGWLTQGQISVVNVFTFAGVLIHKVSFHVFFTNPFIAISWIFVIITTVVWGRSFFCGWLCPFGALQEIIYKVRNWIYPIKKRIDFNEKTRKYLKPLRYVIFILLFCISLYSLRMAEMFVAVEPFKTTWNVGILNRGIGFGAYVVILLVLGAFVYRFFCRFLCPLGAGLSILSRFPLIRLPRRNTCSDCKICKKVCEPCAINNKGEIDSMECLACFSCLEKLYDKKVCPPLISKKIWIKYHERDI